MEATDGDAGSGKTAEGGDIFARSRMVERRSALSAEKAGPAGSEAGTAPGKGLAGTRCGRRRRGGSSRTDKEDACVPGRTVSSTPQARAGRPEYSAWEKQGRLELRQSLQWCGVGVRESLDRASGQGTVVTREEGRETGMPQARGRHQRPRGRRQGSRSGTR